MNHKINSLTKLWIIPLICIAIFASFFMTACGKKGSPSTDPDKDDTNPPVVETTIEEMLKTPKTVYTNLTNELSATYTDIPSDVWWTLKHDNQTKITELTARYVVSNEKSDTFYTYTFSKGWTANQILNNQFDFSVFLGNNNIDKIANSKEKNSMYKSLALALANKQKINLEDVLFCRINKQNQDDITKQQFFISIDTKLERYSYTIKVDTATTVEELATNIKNDKFNIVSQRTTSTFGNSFISINSVNEK